LSPYETRTAIVPAGRRIDNPSVGRCTHCGFAVYGSNNDYMAFSSGDMIFNRRQRIGLLTLLVSPNYDFVPIAIDAMGVEPIIATFVAPSSFVSNLTTLSGRCQFFLSFLFGPSFRVPIGFPLTKPYHSFRPLSIFSFLSFRPVSRPRWVPFREISISYILTDAN
jgi:hypothetical protein